MVVVQLCKQLWYDCMPRAGRDAAMVLHDNGCHGLWVGM